MRLKNKKQDQQDPLSTNELHAQYYQQLSVVKMEQVAENRENFQNWTILPVIMEPPVCTKLVANVLVSIFAFLEITSVSLEITRVCRQWRLVVQDRYSPSQPAYKQALEREMAAFRVTKMMKWTPQQPRAVPSAFWRTFDGVS